MGNVNWHEIYTKIKIFIVKLEGKSREYFSAKGADIYTRFVRRMFFVLILASIVAVFVSGMVLVVASIARPVTKVPSLKGLNVIEASMQVQEKGLQVEIDSKFDPNYDKYTVIEQYPRKGVTVKKGRFVTLLVSMGRDAYTVPDLTGKSREEAERIFNQLNISYDITVIQTSDYPVNTVISQNLPPKSEQERAVKMKIVVNSDVSKGEFRVADYARQSLDIVAKTLLANSVQPVVQKVPTKNPDDDGLILAQNISAGAVVAKNSDIQLQVGVYGEDDKERDKFNYYVFSYFIGGDLATSNATPTDASSVEGQANVRITVSDEQSSDQEVFNKSVRNGEMVVVTFKAFGKSKLSLIVNNNFVKEVSYE